MNAKKELEEALKELPEIKCASIQDGRFNLKVNHTEANLLEFYNSLDFEYDNSFGGQNLFGMVWLKDGTWLSRHIYDGEEWWRYNVCPHIPIELK